MWPRSGAIWAALLHDEAGETWCLGENAAEAMGSFGSDQRREQPKSLLQPHGNTAPRDWPLSGCSAFDSVNGTVHRNLWWGKSPAKFGGGGSALSNCTGLQ